MLTGECPLRGVGRLRIAKSNAVCDVSTKELLPPDYKTTFDETGDFNDEQLIHYISSTQRINTDEAKDRFGAWLSALTDTLNNSGSYEVPAVGKFMKHHNGTVEFRALDLDVPMKPVKAERVVHSQDTHELVVGDKISNSAEMNQVLHEQPIGSKRYMAATISLVAAAILIIVLYYITDGFGIHLVPPDAPDTYISK